MLYIIANETAGSGTGAHALRNVRAYLDGEGIPYRCRITGGPGDASRFAEDALQNGCREIVCLGGDGTIFETVNGLNGRFATLYFVPCGTGNDFVRMLPLPKDPLEALKIQLHGVPRRIDVGRVNEFHFLNVSGSGFDAEVLRQASRFKRLGKGLISYLMGIFVTLHRFRPLPVEMIVDGKPMEKREVTLISVGNGSYFGGGMKAVPHARIDDGLFDLVYVDKIGRLDILKLLAKFISGRHVDLPCTHEMRCRELILRSPGMTVNMDGELTPTDEARYQILPGALEIRLPPEESA